tara:strand:- start:13367 stop:13654 length:288 start_codon:yes stop_codon:yes gene_type:complete
MGHNFWQFTHFISERYSFHQKWERDDKDLLKEIMMIVHNEDPLMGIPRMKKSTHYGSQNAWYHYKKRVGGTLEVWPTAENTDTPYVKPHFIFKFF